MIINLKVYSELILLKAFVDKLNVSDFDGLKFDDSEGSKSECGVSTCEGSDSDHSDSASGDSSDSRNHILRLSSSGPYSISITNLSCQHQT